MKLLILTQKVDKNDDVLGFFHSWIREFSTQCKNVSVICLERGEYDLPHNVEIFSLGKEENLTYNPAKSEARQRRLQPTRLVSRAERATYNLLRKITYIVRFIRYIVRNRNKYDTVFVHMNPEYVVLGGLLWRLWRKKIGLWYVHRQVNLKLRIAEKLAHIIFSTTKEAFRLKSKKIHFLGHGIDLARFTAFRLSIPDVESLGKFHNPIRILHIGRITPIKNLEILVDAVHILGHKWKKRVMVTCVGDPVNNTDEEYFKYLREHIAHHNLDESFSFVGSVPHHEIPRYYKEADVSVNLTPTGGMDKAVLESIASSTFALSANRAFENLFDRHARYLLYTERDSRDLAEKINALSEMNESKIVEMQKYLYERVSKDFKIENLITRIVSSMKDV
ncbi:hypothetical protein CL630_02540 [bacterium]|nr:hypothetical protein [bacterium]|tara:strand:- start:28897 stop:30072 length:1176 start_codon:yes stop_codon:yes gene_type:complete